MTLPGRRHIDRGGIPRSRAESVAGYLFIAVPMLLFLVLNIWSVVYAGWISIWDWNLRTGPEGFLGLDNYTRALRDPVFIKSLWNIAYYVVLWVPLTMAA